MTNVQNPLSRREILFSIDVETDGPCPGLNSLLSLGCVAILPDRTILGSFSVNLELLAGAEAHPKNAAWWQTQPEAWAAARVNAEQPAVGMRRFVEWVNSFEGKKVAAAFPGGFDFTFVYWYCHRFTGESPFGFQCLDIKSLAKAATGLSYSRSSKRNLPKRWFAPVPHTHVAVEDAREQALLMCNILEDLEKIKA